MIASLLTEVEEGRQTYIKYTTGESAGEGTGLMIAIFVSSVMSFGISYGSSWCVRVTSSTTYSMVGALNKLPISIFGMLLFDDAVSSGQVVGVLLAFGAGILYSFAKTQKGKAEELPMRSPVQTAVVPADVLFESKIFKD